MSRVNIIRRTTGILALLMMVLSLFGKQQIEFCLGCEDAEVAEHSCCDKNTALASAAISTTPTAANTTQAPSNCANCTQVVLRLQMAPTGKSVVESAPEHSNERFTCAAVAPRLISIPVCPVENFNSPPRFLRTVQLLI